MATSQLEIEANLRGIAHVLRDLSLAVPPFQRDYSWGREQVDEFWYDLRAAVSADAPYYFMGTVVVSRSGKDRAIVIDGQQRLATTSLLLAAIRDELRRGGEEGRAAALEGRYLTAWSLEDDQSEPRLELNEADRDYFSRVIIDRATPSDVALHRQRLQDAFDRLSELIAEEAQSSGHRWIERLLRWVSFLDSRARVILLETADDGDAFMVFETLNDRGLPLAVADVIKNYLFSLARDHIDEATNLWLSSVQSISSASSEGVFTDFIRQWWSARRGATRERELYASIRAKVRSQDQALDALSGLEAQAPVFAALMDVDHSLWSDLPPSSRESARVLNELGLGQYRPLALAAVSTLAPDASDEILRSAVSWSVRALATGASGGGTAERLYAEAAVRVTNGRSASARAVLHDIDALVAGDREFHAAFATRRIHRSATLRYLLNALKTTDPLAPHADELVALAILPRPDQQSMWNDVDQPDELARMVGRLGNYVLVTREQARSTPNDLQARVDYLSGIAPWMVNHSPTYSLSDLIALVDYRQMAMADEALRVWPRLPVS